MAEETSTFPMMQTAPIVASSQPVQQAIIVAYPKKSPRKEHFKNRYALLIGIILIVSASIAILIGCLGYWAFEERIDMRYYGYGYGHRGFTTVWTAIFMYLSGAFAIVASKTKLKGFIVTTLVISILSAVFALPVIAVSSWIIAEEKLYMHVQPYSYTYWGNNSAVMVTDTPENYERAISLQKGGLSIGVFTLLCGLTEFFCSIILSALCCAVFCCCKQPSQLATDSSQVVYLNAPPGMMPVTNPQTLDSSMFASNLPQASGSDLPPPYSACDAHKVGLTDTEAQAGECPSKVALSGT